MPVRLDEEVVAGIGMYIDITERKHSEERLKKSLQEKQVLLEEVHHRVKNNLAVILGFVQLQMFETEDKKTRNVLERTQLRIKSIALVHEMLYRSESFSRISLEAFIRQLIKNLDDMLSDDTQEIKIALETDDIFISVNRAIPCALLLDELLTNAYKHAFKGRDTGRIMITLRQASEKIYFEVSDNGIGLPTDFDLASSSSLGLNIIETLFAQLEADYRCYSEDGAVFEFSFACA